MRETLPFVQQNSGQRLLSSSYIELGKSVFSPPRKGVCNECFLNHSYSLEPHLSAWLENTAKQFLYLEQKNFPVLFRTKEIHMLSLFRKWSPNPFPFHVLFCP
jgi:hypothetical protein